MQFRGGDRAIPLHLGLLLFNLPSLSSLSERPTYGVDGDGDLAMEDSGLGVFFRNSEKA